MIAYHGSPECISCPHSILVLLLTFAKPQDLPRVHQICSFIASDKKMENHLPFVCKLWGHHRDFFFQFHWDHLSSECKLEAKACISTGREPTNLVSSVLVEHKQKKRIPICYLEDSYTDAICHYMVYAPIDIPTINAITVGNGNPDTVAILASGFAILPDESNVAEERRNKDQSILSIMFQIIDQNASLEFIPPQSVVTSTTMKIQDRFMHSH